MPGEGSSNPLQYSCLENPMDGGAWWAALHGVVKSRTQLSNFLFTFHFHALEKEMATHSSVLAWRVPGTGEPGGLPSMGSHRVGHDWSDLAAAELSFLIHMIDWSMTIHMIGHPWWPWIIPESQGWRSLVGYSPWGQRVRHDWATNYWVTQQLHP